MAVPLDQLTVSIYNVRTNREEKVPALHPQRREDVKFVLYQAPPVGTTSHQPDEATLAEYCERLTFVRDDLRWLLSLAHDQFWCQVIFDESVHRCIDSYLRYAPRSFDVVFNLPEELNSVHHEIHRMFFMTCVRMATHKESKKHFITPEEFGKILYENYIFDIPKLMDLSVLYGAGNGPLLTKMINNIFTQQPHYTEDLRSTVPTILEILQAIGAQCGVKANSVPGTPLKLQSDREQSPLLSLDSAKLQDVVFYLSDTAHTLWAFMDVYPQGASAFVEADFPATLASVCDSLFPVLSEAVQSHKWASTSHRDLIRVKVMSAHACLLKVFRQIISQTCIVPLLDNCSPEEAESLVEQYLQLMSSVLGERRFLAKLEYLYPFCEDRDILSQSLYPVDETRLQFVQDAFNEAFALYGKRRGPTPTHTETPLDATEIDDPGIQTTVDDGLLYEAADYDEVHVGAGAPTITGVELDSLISSVKDLLPDLGDGFIEICLEETNYSVEKVINMVLEDKLPPSLKGYSKTLAREKVGPEPTLDHPILAERRNIYDNDEFDVFSKDKIDTSKIHQGKKEKMSEGAANILDDKQTVDALRPLYDRYGSEFVESMYDKEGGEYDDEYDDTYDSNLVGAADADSADELTARRPFTVPRIFMGNQKETNKDTNDESSEEEERPPRDNFVEDPAKIRQRQEQRRAEKQALRRKPGSSHKAQGQSQPQSQKQEGEGQGQKKYDVKGNPKGQGQSSEVLRNRAHKEKNKASRAHHNRKALSDKKRKL